MKKLFSALFSLVMTVGFSQSPSVYQHCGYDWIIDKHEKDQPGYKEYLEKSFQHLKNRAKWNKTDFTYIIPTVVHVVYQNSSQNLSDERINRVLHQLNRDFARSNSDTINVRQVFQDRAANPAIHFELKGIVRVPTDTTFELNFLTGELPDHVKSSADGGSDAWDVQRYLNIWICNIEDRILLGYAYPPSCAPNWPEGFALPESRFDGVVVHYEAFDTTGSISVQGTTVNFRGRVLTHEVGHYLGLRHIWGDGATAILGIPDCNADDGLEDTPNQGLSSNFSCNFNLNTCSNEDQDLPDMIENYMDYSSESCQNMFTMQQVGVMRAALRECRNQLLTNAEELNSSVGTELQLYPNPASNWLNISLQIETSSKAQVLLRNSQGQVTLDKSVRLDMGTAQLNISDLSPGLYFVEVSAEQRRSITRIFIR